MVEIDLADLLGGLGEGGEFGDILADLAPAVVDSAPMVDEVGEPIEGLYAVSMDLFAE